MSFTGHRSSVLCVQSQYYSTSWDMLTGSHAIKNTQGVILSALIPQAYSDLSLLLRFGIFRQSRPTSSFGNKISMSYHSSGVHAARCGELPAFLVRYSVKCRLPIPRKQNRVGSHISSPCWSHMRRLSPGVHCR